MATSGILSSSSLRLYADNCACSLIGMPANRGWGLKAIRTHGLVVGWAPYESHLALLSVGRMLVTFEPDSGGPQNKGSPAGQARFSSIRGGPIMGVAKCHCSSNKSRAAGKGVSTGSSAAAARACAAACPKRTTEPFAGRLSCPSDRASRRLPRALQRRGPCTRASVDTVAPVDARGAVPRRPLPTAQGRAQPPGRWGAYRR